MRSERFGFWLTTIYVLAFGNGHNRVTNTKSPDLTPIFPSLEKGMKGRWMDGRERAKFPMRDKQEGEEEKE